MNVLSNEALEAVMMPKSQALIDFCKAHNIPVVEIKCSPMPFVNADMAGMPTPQAAEAV